MVRSCSLIIWFGNVGLEGVRMFWCHVRMVMRLHRLWLLEPLSLQLEQLEYLEPAEDQKEAHHDWDNCDGLEHGWGREGKD